MGAPQVLARRKGATRLAVGQSRTSVSCEPLFSHGRPEALPGVTNTAVLREILALAGGAGAAVRDVDARPIGELVPDGSPKSARCGKRLWE